MHPEHDELTLELLRLKVDTQQQAVVFMPKDCHVCRSEGFNSLSRVELSVGDTHVVAGLSVDENGWVPHGAAGVSEAAWQLLGKPENTRVRVTHPKPLDSLAAVRAKLYGHRLPRDAFQQVINDVVAGRFSESHLAAFVAAGCGDRLDFDETVDLTWAMVEAGERLHWERPLVLDKHCVGGLPGNRTTPLVVAIVAAAGLCIPKTSSRAITSPAGTADTMETLAPVNLDITAMRAVVEKEGGCVVWGGSVNLSPADDILIRVERALDLDSEGQMIASVLSKKIAAGATHVLLDIPVGPTAKVRDEASALRLASSLISVGDALGISVKIHLSSGLGPVGRGVGPALEAMDVLAVLQNDPNAPDDLRCRAIDLAGSLLELGGAALPGEGREAAMRMLTTGAAWTKFQAICNAQGGMREPPQARYREQITSEKTGMITSIDNRILARIAKLAGAPASPAAGILLHMCLSDAVVKGQPLFSLHASSKGEMAYALEYAQKHADIFQIT